VYEVIGRFRDQATRDLWEGLSTKDARRIVALEHHGKAATRLDFVFRAASMTAFALLPPGADFKALHGAFRGFYQLRIAGPDRIRFSWDGTETREIQAGQFHDQD
jgi:plasmid maintenance system killer protein